MDIPNVFYILQSVIYQLIQFSSNFHHHGHPIYHLLIWSRKLLHDPVAHGAAPHGQDMVKWRKMGCWLVWIMQPEWFLFMEVTIFSTFFWGVSPHGFHLLSRYHSAKRLIRPSMNLHLHWRFIHHSFSHSIFKRVCRKIGYCISNSDGLSTFYRHFPYWNWPWAIVKSCMISIVKPFRSIHHNISQASHTFLGFPMVFIRVSPGLHVFSPWFPMIFAEALGAAGEELQIQVVCQQGSRGPGVSPLFFVGKSREKGGKTRGFYIWNLGKKTVCFFFPLESDRKESDFSYEKSGIRFTKWILPWKLPGIYSLLTS